VDKLGMIIDGMVLALAVSMLLGESLRNGKPSVVILLLSFFTAAVSAVILLTELFGFVF
jgi:hypothetical protein